MRHAETVIMEGLDTGKMLPLEFGGVPVRLPEWPEQLYLVVVRGFGEKPMLLLANVALVLAAVYFAAVWLGESLKLAVLTTRVIQTAKRFFGTPGFHYYALASGIATLFSRLGRWKPSPRPPPNPSVGVQLAWSFLNA